MADYALSLQWKRTSDTFDYDSYSRAHTIQAGDATMCASASPDFKGDASCINPEQSFAASMASCHMLTFLALASKKGYVIDAYTDHAAAQLGKNEKGMSAITRIVLAPHVIFDTTTRPSQKDYDYLHQRAHHYCFIANSVAQCVTVSIQGTFE
jgi:organic hydroperoxide reductase OsmC/OhrA